MIRFFLCFLLLSVIVTLNIKAQTLQYDSLILTVDQFAPEFKGYLVQLAWHNYPTAKVFDHEVNIAEQEIKNERLGWTRALGVNVGVNQQSNQVNFEGGGTGLVFFPRISYGLSVNFTPLITTPGRVKVAQEKKAIADDQVDQEKLRLRAEIYQRYENHLLAVELLNIRTQVEQDASANYKLLQGLFKNDEATFKDYNDAYMAFSRAKEETQEAKTLIQLSVIQIEELIGIDFEDAKRMFFQR